MGKIAVKIIDSETNEMVPAKAQVISSSGEYVSPKDAIQKVGPGHPFFYSDGSFEVDVTRGTTRITVERGTEYSPRLPVQMQLILRFRDGMTCLKRDGTREIHTSTMTRKNLGQTSDFH